MTVEELLTEIRRKLDDEVTPPLWADADLFRYLNNAVDEVCERTRVLQDSTSDVCSITLAADTASYTLDPSVFAVRRARIEGQRDPLDLVNAKDLDRLSPGWDDSTLASTGTPTHAVFDLGDTTITLHPAPSEEMTLRLTVWRRAIESEILEDDADEPVIPARFHRKLVDWVLFEAYSDSDTEKRNEEKAALHEAAFERAVGRRPSAHEMRQWSTARTTGIKAHWF